MHTREKGEKGESVACTFLENKGFTIVTRNYQKKWGELDIIAKKGDVLHFVEVKSVTSTYSSQATDTYRPEDNVHPLKARKIRRMINTYLSDFSGQEGGIEIEFYFHVICVFMNLTTHLARVKWIKDVVL